MVHTLADAFAAEVAEMCATNVTDGQWRRFLDQSVPLSGPRTGDPLSTRSLTLAERKRETL